ncbi:hypothetical protein SAMN06295937_100441 [Sphingopyxis flava]|uniref:Uncharacterized protein n=1 Tax=Sphingopyxis flava TaxID=1507287 RepID=A0A1T5AMG5_9SPHN|nr:hypothetical protein SAMN06295937_100441 [Sphingopyxis flava]
MRLHPEQGEPIGRAAELLGDRAMLLILGELFFGRGRFKAITANSGLGSQLVSAAQAAGGGRRG